MKAVRTVSKDESVVKEEDESIEALLSAPSAREKETRKVTGEILDLLNKPTARVRLFLALVPGVRCWS